MKIFNSPDCAIIVMLKYSNYKKVKKDQSWHSATKCDCKRDWLWIRFPLEEIKYLLKFIFPFFRSGTKVKARRCISPLNTQCLQNSAENGEWSVLTLGSLSLTCYVWKANKKSACRTRPPRLSYFYEILINFHFSHFKIAAKICGINGCIF